MSNKERNIVFIIPGFLYIEDYQKNFAYNDIPVGTLQLSSFLKAKRNIKTNIIDLRVEGEQYIGIDLSKPDYYEFKKFFLEILVRNDIQEYNNIGINCYSSYQFLYTELLCRVLKEEFPDINIIVGGYHPEACPDDFKNDKSLYDFIIQGEAEISLLKLFDSKFLKKKRNLSRTRIIINKEIIDINELPIPDYELYLTQYPYKDKFQFNFYVSRGCPYQCSFCATNYIFRSLRYKTFKNHFDKLCEIVGEFSTNPKIHFSDQCFNRISIKEKILDHIIMNELSEKFTFSAQNRIDIDSINRQLISKYRKCSLIIGYGLENVNKNILFEMHKVKNPTKYLNQTTKILNEYKKVNDIYCRLNLIVGFCGEDKKTFDELIKFINTNAQHENIQVNPGIFTNFPNSLVYDNQKYYKEKYGTIFKKKWWKLHSNPFKNAILEKPSRNYSSEELIRDYKEDFLPLLKEFKHTSMMHLINWKKYYNKWYDELCQKILIGDKKC